MAATPEVPRLFIDEFGDQSFFQRGQNTFVRQTMIMSRQIEIEATLIRENIEVLLCDRTIADHWAYTRSLFPEEAETREGVGYKNIVRRWLDSYDAIFILPIAFPLELDGVREADESFRQSIEQSIFDIYRDRGREPQRIEGSIDERSALLVSKIKAILKLP